MMLNKLFQIYCIAMFAILLVSCANEQDDQQNVDVIERKESKKEISVFKDQTERMNIDFKLRFLDENEYSGIKVGKLFYLEISITNNSDTDVTVGDYFRVIMNENPSSWGIMSMGARGDTRLKAKNLRSLCYGSGASSISMAGEKGDGMLISYTSSIDVINDQTASQKNVWKNWPNKIGANETIVIKWPFFWFSDTSDRPLYLASPSIGSEKKRSFYWVNFETNKVRRINADEKDLKNIISNKTESLALRSASVRWLMEAKLSAQKYLLQYIQKGDTPATLSYRCMQALVIWGSESTIDKIFALWKRKRIASEIEKNLTIYLTWSEHENANKVAEKIKAGAR